MFYSQTFLARKGPLGTVWCAAHLQHRLKKSHYTSTDIPFTVDLIMFPEVPIALRMSGHLLLGVVRIYSKKVDYLFQDCNVALAGLIKAFASIEVNLPEDARQAPFESITLPETLNLEAFDFDDNLNDGDLNNHLKSMEDITLADQIPTEIDPYVAITFDEDMFVDLSDPVEVPSAGDGPMDTDDHFMPPVDENPNELSKEQDREPARDAAPSNQPEVATGAMDAQDSAPSTEEEVINQTVEFQDSDLNNPSEVSNAGLRQGDSSPQDIPEIETMRDAVHDFSPGNPPFLDQTGNMTEPILSFDQVMTEKETVLEDMLTSGGPSLQFQQRSEPIVSPVSHQAPESFDIQASFGHPSPALAVMPTPPVQQPEQRTRKRKHFDRATVLTNRFMKQALLDSSDLRRRRKNIPSSIRAEWKFKNSMRKEQVFQEPLLTGFSGALSNIFKNDFIARNPNLIVEEVTAEPMVPESPNIAITELPQPGVQQSPNLTNEANPETTVADSPPSVPEYDLEIEHLRHDAGGGDNNFDVSMPPSPGRSIPSMARSNPSPVRSIPSSVRSIPSLFRSIPSPVRSTSPPFQADFTPISMNTLEASALQTGATGTGSYITPNFTASTANYESELETQRTGEPLDGENTGLTDIAEVDEGLSFLDTADNSPTESQATQGVDSLSVRTRAVARYLKECPALPFPEGQSGDLSLKKILEGKTRKLCSRMFFETLVLKSYGLIDVNQEQPYGDITLKLTPTMSKTQV